MNNIFKKINGTGNYPIVFLSFTFTVTVVFSLLYNLQLFRNQYPPEYFTILVLMSIGRDMIIWYIAGLNRWFFAVFTPIIFAFGAALNYFIHTVKMSIGIGLFELIFQTNVSEAVGVINPALVRAILTGIFIALIFVALRFCLGGIKTWKMRGILLVLLILPVVLGKLPEKELKEVKYGKGGNTERGYTAMPEKILENIYHYAKNQYRLKKLLSQRKNRPLPEVGYNGEAETLVFILTDALRPDHMGINGYGRDTTPNMVKNGFISFADMYACETSTTRSVPCLMTRASRNEPMTKYVTEPSILSMFKAAGFDTAWISSQGSISTADTGPSVVASDADYIFFNDGGINKPESVIYDKDLLPKLDDFLSGDNPKKVLVLHLNGSHWEYRSRYTPEQKKWTPDCSKWVYDCAIDEVVNAYDNTIVATDEFVDDVVERLKGKNAVIFFSSDHGQFLGEYDRRIHSHELLQYKEVGVVPFAIWASDSMKNNKKLLTALGNKNKITTHDNIFHTITDCIGLESSLIDDNLSICSENLLAVPNAYED